MPKKVDHSKRRLSIAKAAFEVIARDGIGAATISAVANEAKISAPLLKHYIKSKDQLLMEAYVYLMSLVLERMAAAETSYKGKEALRRALFVAIPFDKKTKDMYRVGMAFGEMAIQNTTVRKMVDRGTREAKAHFVSVIEEAKELGEAPKNIDAEMTAWGAMLLIVGFGADIVCSGRKITLADKQNHIDHWISKMLA